MVYLFWIIILLKRKIFT